MTLAKTIPARLHVLLARNVPYGVVIRRGPSKRVCTVAWNRQDDTFVVGQWLRGRIYERRSDLSPCGRYLLYFAMNGRWDSEVQGAWTAISLAPYLKAIGLWAKGDCWNGGGLFVSDREFWLNDGYGHKELKSPSELRRVEEFPGERFHGNECLGVYYPRLQRDGWQLVREVHRGKSGCLLALLRLSLSPFAGADGSDAIADVFEKQAGGDWVLTKYACVGGGRHAGRGVYYDQHEIENRGTGQLVQCPCWEWADVDGGRLIWAEGGKLFTGSLGSTGLEAVRELYDFNAMTPSRIRAPY